MPSGALKNLSHLWTDACKSMWMGIAALRRLETSLRVEYGTLPVWKDITEWLWAPECKGRLGDSKDVLLASIPQVIDYAATVRVVLLAAGFEAYFEQFLADYVAHRPRYHTAAGRTPVGDKLWGDVMKLRERSARIEELASLTGMKIASLRPRFQVLDDVYALRNTVAHDAGVVDAATAARVKTVPLTSGATLRITPAVLVETLAPPVFWIAKELDKRVVPHK